MGRLCSMHNSVDGGASDGLTSCRGRITGCDSHPSCTGLTRASARSVESRTVSLAAFRSKGSGQRYQSGKIGTDSRVPRPPFGVVQRITRRDVQAGIRAFPEGSDLTSFPLVNLAMAVREGK